MDDPTILIPLDVSEPVAPARGLVELLHPMKIVLLGYYPVPDQTTPEQLQSEHGDEVTAAVDSIAESFTKRGASVEPLVVFTADRSKTVDRVANEYACDAVLTDGEVDGLTDVLVALKGDTNLDRIVSFVGDLLRENDANVTLFHVASDEEDAAQTEFILRGAADRLAEEGIDSSRIEWEQSTSDRAADEIATVAADHDIVVIGETKPSLKDRILGDVPTDIIDHIDRPVLIVRRSP